MMLACFTGKNYYHAANGRKAAISIFCFIIQLMMLVKV